MSDHVISVNFNQYRGSIFPTVVDLTTIIFLTMAIMLDFMGNKFHSANRSNSSRRRNIMKTVASAIGVSTLIPAVSTGQASTTDEQHKYRGITYEPVTLTQQGQARAEVREVDEELSGELRIPGFKIPLEDDQGGLTLDSKRDQFNKYTVTKSEKKFTKDDSSLNVTLFVSDHVIVGRLTRDSVEYGPLSFTLGATKHGFSVEHAQSGLDSIQKSPVGADSITVPDKVPC